MPPKEKPTPTKAEPEKATLLVDNNTDRPFQVRLDGGGPKEVEAFRFISIAVAPGPHDLTIKREAETLYRRHFRARSGRTYLVDPVRLGRYVTWPATKRSVPDPSSSSHATIVQANAGTCTPEGNGGN